MVSSVARILGWLAMAIGLILFWGWATLPLLDAMTMRGWFGSCFEGACGYTAAFVWWPSMTLGGTLVSLLALAWAKRRGVRR